jgi:NADH:ubiquinone oxidoreductase subunit K
MIPLFYILSICVALVSIGIAGVAIEKNFITLMLAIELIFLASTIAFVGFFSYSLAPNASGFVGLITVWAVAAVEIISLIAIYIYMKANGFDFDIALLSKLKW